MNPFTVQFNPTMSSPALTLPASQGSTVRVSLLHAGRTTATAALFVQQQIPGHDVLDAPCYSFLIENDNLGKKVLYDLGIMKAWREKLPPSSEHYLSCDFVTRARHVTHILPRFLVIDRIENYLKAVINVTTDVADQLKAASLPLTSINSIIWSHHHMDHIGDPSLFPESTSLVVGPGFKSNKRTYPGYPKNPDAVVSQSALEGRELVELDFAGVGLEIGGFKALDFFGDGSFYLLQATGHS
jgi:glyoxylase-like metal-dependent hydrolase (beta-lactamase superfamily II)